MPRNDLISFKKDKDAQFAAQLVMQSLSRSNVKGHNVTDLDSLERLFWYRAALQEKAYKYKTDDQSGHYELISQLLEEVMGLEELLTRNLIFKRDPLQTRDIVIDATKSLKRIQSMQETLTKKKIHIFGSKDGNVDLINGPWGSPDYVNAYVAVMGRCKEGAAYLDSDVFNADDPQVVAEFDEMQKSRPYFRPVINRNIDQKKTYLMDEATFNAYKENRKSFQPVNNNAVENNSLITSDRPDSLYTVDKLKIQSFQNHIMERVSGGFISDFDEPDKGYSKSLYDFVNDLKKFHYEVQNKPEVADDSMKYTDNLLTLKKVKKTVINNKEKYELQLNLQNPEEPKFLDKFISFIDRIEHCNRKTSKKEKVEQKELDKIFSNPEDGDGFCELLADLKNIEKDPKIPSAFKNQCKMIRKRFDNLVMVITNNIECSEYERYVIKNTGPLNSGSGESLVDGVAKVTAAYEWKKQNERKPASKKESFDKSKVDALAEEIKKNPAFKLRYTKMENGKEKWSEYSLKKASMEHTEWKVNNMIENPFGMADKARKLIAVRKLRELADLLPPANDGSSDYERFNNKIRNSKKLDLNKISDGELNYYLKDISIETEKYMKGRKSERYKDKSTEHFEESLDVLKILSDVNDYGKAFAKKLVDRTNYVRTHRWNNKTQKTVTLEGRGTEATKERIEILKGIKKAPVTNEVKKP